MKQKSDEWFAARKGRITASNVGAILGSDPYRDKADVMRAMVRSWHDAETEFTGNVATEYGSFHEAGALVEYKMETGNEVEEVGFVTRGEWAGASPDGLLSLTGGIEIKCPYGKRKMTPSDSFKTLEDQPHYYDQIQFSMWVTQRAYWHFFQWSSKKSQLVEVRPDSKWRTKNIKKLQAFWEHYLNERESNFEIHLEAKRLIIDTPEAHKVAAEYDELKDTIEAASERLGELKATIVEMAHNKNALFAGKLVTKVEKKGAVSYAKAMKADALTWTKGKSAKDFTGKPSTYWKIG